MNGLLDHIFSSLDHEKLGRQEVESYLRYINEILPQLTFEKQKIKFIQYKIKLNQRIIAIDKQEVIKIERVVASQKRKLNLRKFRCTFSRLEMV